jgi:hypothetical protein
MGLYTIGRDGGRFKGASGIFVSAEHGVESNKKKLLIPNKNVTPQRAVN